MWGHRLDQRLSQTFWTSKKKDWSKKSFFVGLNDGAAILVVANLNSCYDKKIARPLDSWEDKSNDSS